MQAFLSSMLPVLRIALPILGMHIVALAVVLVMIKLIVGSYASRTIKRVRLVEDEVRHKESDIKRQIEQHDRELAAKKSELENELQTQRESGRRDAARLKEQAIADAKTEREKIIAQAKKAEEKMRQQLQRHMEERAVQHGGRIFDLVFSDLMSASLNRQFIAELLDALNEIDEGSLTLESHDAEVVASHPMDDDQKARLLEILTAKFGDKVTLTEKADESILGGMVLKLGSLEIDGSLRNRYREAVDEVVKEAHSA
jgi:F0F1-type ATP synthase membrane subunit b/b'